mmetsp:Transcript_58487/g.102822  ORF Transcript_58487/g.102822 Transcript_58487/m.102822 type:complete len:308 (-) Transcript_58487:581-1504(-)
MVQLGRHLHLHEVHLPSQQTADAAETAAELGALLRAVRDELQLGAEALVVVGEPLHEGLAIYYLELHARDRVVEVGVVALLVGGQVQHALLARAHVADHKAVHCQVLPDNQRLDGTHLQGLECVLHHEAVLAGVLRDLVHVALQQTLLLHQLHVGQALGGQLDGLVETRLHAVGHVHSAQDGLGETRIEAVRVEQHFLEVRRTRENQTRHVTLVVRDEIVRRQLSHLRHVVVTLLETQTSETQSRLTSTAVLLWKIHSKLVQNGARVTLQGSVQRAVSVHNNESKCVVVLKKLVQGLSVELVVAQIQ